MIELTLILFQFFLLFILFLFPITPYLNSHYLGKYNFDIYNIFCLNIIINLNIFLIFSIFIKNIELLFLINLGLAILFLLYNLKKNILFFKLINWKLLFLFFLVNISIFISIAEDPKLNWDGVVQWLPKASTYFQGLGFTDVGAHTYPHLGGFLWGYFWKNSFSGLEYSGRFFYIFFYILSIFSLINLLQINKKLKFPILLVFIIFILSITYDRFLFGGYQDTLLFSLLIMISNILYLIIVKNYKNFLTYSLYFMGAFICCWIKQEGLIYFFILSFILIFYEKRTKFIILNSIAFLVLLSIYFLLKLHLIGEVQFDQKIDFKIFNSFEFEIFKSIFLPLTINIFAAIIKYPLWLIILFFISISIFTKKNIPEIKYAYSFFVLNSVFIIFVIFYSCLNLNLDTCSLIMRVSMDRILYQSSGFYLIWIIYIFHKSEFFSKNRSYFN